MTLHSGRRFERDGVAIGSVDVEAVRTSRVAADVAESTAYWLDQALQRSDVYYFSIYSADKPIGQILLHDISSSGDTSLVAYHVFRPASRGKGIGTKALKLLQQYVVENTQLHTLTIITSLDNVASQRVAVKCEFRPAGPAREGPDLRVYQWNVNRSRQPFA